MGKEREGEKKRGGGARGEESGIREEAWIIHQRITTGLRQGGSQKYPRPRRLGAITLQRSTTRQQPLLLPVSVGSGSKTLGGIIKSHCDVAVYSKTSTVMQYKAEAHTSPCASHCLYTHRTFTPNGGKARVALTFSFVHTECLNWFWLILICWSLKRHSCTPSECLPRRVLLPVWKRVHDVSEQEKKTKNNTRQKPGGVTWVVLAYAWI